MAESEAEAKAEAEVLSPPREPAQCLNDSDGANSVKENLGAASNTDADADAPPSPADGTTDSLASKTRADSSSAALRLGKDLCVDVDASISLAERDAAADGEAVPSGEMNDEIAELSNLGCSFLTTPGGTTTVTTHGGTVVHLDPKSSLLERKQELEALRSRQLAKKRGSQISEAAKLTSKALAENEKKLQEYRLAHQYVGPSDAASSSSLAPRSGGHTCNPGSGRRQHPAQSPSGLSAASSDESPRQWLLSEMDSFYLSSRAHKAELRDKEKLAREYMHTLGRVISVHDPSLVPYGPSPRNAPPTPVQAPSKELRRKSGLSTLDEEMGSQLSESTSMDTRLEACASFASTNASTPRRKKDHPQHKRECDRDNGQGTEMVLTSVVQENQGGEHAVNGNVELDRGSGLRGMSDPSRRCACDEAPESASSRPVETKPSISPESCCPASPQEESADETKREAEREVRVTADSAFSNESCKDSLQVGADDDLYQQLKEVARQAAVQELLRIEVEAVAVVTSKQKAHVQQNDENHISLSPPELLQMEVEGGAVVSGEKACLQVQNCVSVEENQSGRTLAQDSEQRRISVHAQDELEAAGLALEEETKEFAVAEAMAEKIMAVADNNACWKEKAEGIPEACAISSQEQGSLQTATTEQSEDKSAKVLSMTNKKGGNSSGDTAIAQKNQTESEQSKKLARRNSTELPRRRSKQYTQGSPEQSKKTSTRRIGNGKSAQEGLGQISAKGTRSGSIDASTNTNKAKRKSSASMKPPKSVAAAPRKQPTQTPPRQGKIGTPRLISGVSLVRVRPSSQKTSPYQWPSNCGGGSTVASNISSPRRKTVPLYNGRAIEKSDRWDPTEKCSLRWDPHLHRTRKGCERCLHLASSEEIKEFEANGHHLRINLVRGGCHRSCSYFPRKDDEHPVRLCHKCFYDTHELKLW